jgi:hypothetical protein
VQTSTPAKRVRADPTGEWAGFYNDTLAIHLVVREKDANSFRGRMDYPSEGTVTIVEGAIHQNWALNDEVWAQISAESPEPYQYALSFKETKYARKGSSDISFSGEYRALVTDNNSMSGAWFDGKRLVGLFTLRRIDSI